MLDDNPNKEIEQVVNDQAKMWAKVDELTRAVDEESPQPTVHNGSEAMIDGYRPSVDAGMRAAERIRSKAAAIANGTARLIKWIIGTSIALAIVVISSAGYYGWENRVTGRLSDDRSCKVEYKDLTITGKRTYSYPFTEIFGFRFIDTKAIDERTVIDIRGDALVVVGQSGSDWWSLAIGPGEQGIQILKAAESYTFVMGKKAVLVKSKEFCF